MANEPSRNSWRSPAVGITALGMVLLAGIISLAVLRDRFVNRPEWQVSVTGQGRVAYQPDIANVVLGVQIDRAARAEDALQQLNINVNNTINAIVAAGVAKTDIQTQTYSLYPIYDYPANGTPRPNGYSSSQQLLVKVRSLGQNPDMVGKVVSAATKAGANVVIGVTFEVSNLNDLKQQARIAAIGDAKARAGELADTAGVRLGKVVGWWENLIQAPGSVNPYMDGKDMGGVGTSVTPQQPNLPGGTQEIIIEVGVNYKVR